MKKLYTLTILIFIHSAIHSQYVEPDNTFGGDGHVFPPFYGFDLMSAGRCMDMTTTGSLLCAGYAENSTGFDYGSFRLNLNGSTVANFGVDGQGVQGSDYGFESFADCEILSGNKTLYVGEYLNENLNNYGYVLMRLTSSGSLDATFSDDGYEFVNSGAEGLDYLKPELEIDDAGNIYVAFLFDDGSFAPQIVILKYDSNGNPDMDFNGGEGQLVLETGEYSQLCDMKIINDNIYISGMGDGFFLDELSTFIAKYDLDGFIDSSFGVGGYFVGSDNYTEIEILDIHLTSANKLACTGKRGFDLMVMQVTLDGDWDQTFSDDGYFEMTSLPGEVKGMAIESYSNGKLIVAGTSEVNNEDSAFLCRLNNDGTPDDSFNPDGIYFPSYGDESAFNDMRLYDDSQIITTGYYNNAEIQNFLVSKFAVSESGVVEISDLQIHFYPNPANEYVMMQTPYSSLPVQVNVMSTDGKLVMSTQVKDPTHMIRLDEFKSGTYIMQVIEQDKISNQMLVKY
jgi:uncharacterized delta-60 repeat protein